jgi:hypothetical protein
MLKCRKNIILFYSLAVLVIMLISSPAMGEYRTEIIPSLVIGMEYDDNIDLESENEKSDYITTVSPQIKVTMNSDTNGLDLSYSPTWVWYHEYTENDTVRHNGSLNFWQQLSEHLKFDLSEAYLRSEETTEEVFVTGQAPYGVRHTREYIYERNRIGASLDYQFGPENHLIIGYSHEFLENEDPSLDDTTEHGPYGTLSYWFNNRNGIELGYRFTRDEFEREDGSPSEDDFDSHEADARYIHRFGLHTSVYITYGLTERNFTEAPKEDRRVHEGGIGFEHGFSPRTSLSLGVGYYKPDGYVENEGHISYAATLNRNFEHGTISLSGESGWDEDYLEAERREFTRFWSLGGSISYQLLENLNSHVGISHRKNRDELGIEDETYRGRCGLRLEFLRLFSASLNYTYSNCRSDDPDDDYVDNRVMLMLSASRAFQWK